MNRRIFFLFFILLFSVFAMPHAASAQDGDPEFRLDLNRDFGYGAGANVRGNFSARLYGNLDNVASVIYRIDGEELGRSAEPPFHIKFVTGSFPDGWHDLWAEVETKDGRVVQTPSVRMNFLSAEEQNNSMGRIFGIILPIILVITIVGVIAQTSALRGAKSLPPGAKRSYGIHGGAVCPRCGRPFPIHMWSFGLLVGRYDRCENCGKWSLVRAAPPEILAAAEAAELASYRSGESAIPAAAAESEEQRLKRMLDESRYTREE